VTPRGARSLSGVIAKLGRIQQIWVQRPKTQQYKRYRH
jgi:hypothetical protein